MRKSIPHKKRIFVKNQKGIKWIKIKKIKENLYITQEKNICEQSRRHKVDRK